MSYVSDTMYSRNIHKDPICWGIAVEIDEDNNGVITKSYGRVDGSIQHKRVIITEGKNLGKRNATNAYEQAKKEAKADVKRKTKEGYVTLSAMEVTSSRRDHNVVFEHEGTIWMNNKLAMLEEMLPEFRLDANGFNKPMKAQPFKAGKFDTGICQPKINGVRAFVSYRVTTAMSMFDDGKNVYITSKEGMSYDLPHIKEHFKALYDTGKVPEDVVFDGEIYLKDTHVTTIGGAARNVKNPINAQLGYVCFDLAMAEHTQTERDIMRNHYLGSQVMPNEYSQQQFNRVFNLHTTTLNESEFAGKTNHWLELGYEGGIIRDADATYKFGSRPQTMMKLKKFFDAEYRLIDIIPAGKDTDKHGNATCLFLCITSEGSMFKVTPTGYSKEAKAQMLINKESHLGKSITVKYYETTKNGLPFHANGWIRDYE